MNEEHNDLAEGINWRLSEEPIEEENRIILYMEGIGGDNVQTEDKFKIGEIKQDELGLYNFNPKVSNINLVTEKAVGRIETLIYEKKFWGYRAR